MTFYLKIGSACVYHCNHVALDCTSLRLPSRRIQQEDAELLLDGRQASVPANTARNLFYIHSGGDLLSKTKKMRIYYFKSYLFYQHGR
jgi:hypothetical protein